MKASRHSSRWNNLWTIAQAATAAYSLWAAWRRKHPATPHGRAMQPGYAATLPIDERYRALASMEGVRGQAGQRASGGSYVKSLGRIASSAANAWSSHRAASKGAALALYTLFSLAPILVLVVSITSVFFGEETVKQMLLEQMSGLIGPQGSDAIKTILSGAHQESDSVIAGIISGMLVLISATSAFAELKDSLDELWEIPKTDGSGIWAFLRERFLSFGLLLVLALMLLASLVVSAALSALGNIWGDIGPDSYFQLFAQFVSSAVSFLIVTLLFAVIFKYLPATHIAWRDVFVGALLTAVLFMAGKAAIGLYLGHGNFSSSYGAAGSIVALITWIYYSAQIFFYGSLFTHEYAMRIGSRSHRGKGQA